MAAPWEVVQCLENSVNQGTGQCVIDFGRITYMIAIPKGEIITAADLANFPAFLEQKAHEDDPFKRYYLLGEFVSYAAANTDPTVETATGGATRNITMGTVGFTLTQWKGGICGYKNLLKFHQAEDRFDFLIYYANGVIQGVLTKDTNGQPAMRGISMSQVFVATMGMATGSEGTIYTITFRVGDVAQMRELLTYWVSPDGFDVYGVMKPFVDVQLVGNAVAGAPTGDYNVLAVTGCGGISLSDLYATELSVPSAWIVTNAQTGATISVTSVGISNNMFLLTLDSADTDYPTAGGSVKIRLAYSSDLEAIGVIGYESGTVVIPIG